MIFWMFGRRVCVDLERVAKELPEGHLTGLRITLGKLTGLGTEADRDGCTLVARSLGHKTSVAQSRDKSSASQLRAAGFFSWGLDAWIHEDDEGTVMDTEWALSTIQNQG